MRTKKKQIVHNPTIFNGVPETKQEMGERDNKAQLTFMFFVFCGWFAIKGIMSFIFPADYSLFSWSIFVDPLAFAFGVWAAFHRGWHYLQLYRCNTSNYGAAFSMAYRELQFPENKAKVKAYMDHPNFKERKVTMAEVTALKSLVHAEKCTL